MVKIQVEDTRKRIFIADDEGDSVQKGQNLEKKTVNVEEGLAQHLGAIYEDPFQQKIKPLNYGWRGHSAVRLDKDSV